MTIKSIVSALKRIFFRKSTRRQHGTIKFFDRKKRFGFIITDDQEYFFHASATPSESIKGLRDGRAVTFVVINGTKGPQADKIELLKD